MMWIWLATAAYIVVGLGFYFFGFRVFKALRKNRGASSELFDPPRSQPFVLFFRGLGVFLVFAGVVFFLVMTWTPAARR
jgi:hypothetical protein